MKEDRRIFELALQALIGEREKLDQEIDNVRKRLEAPDGKRKAKTGETKKRKGRKFTAADKKAQAARMKKYWAAKKTAAKK